MAEDFLSIIKRASLEAVENEKPLGVVFGKVLTAEPLTVFVEQRFKIDERRIILSKFVTDFETEISFDDASIKYTVTSFNMEEGEESLPYKLSDKVKVRRKATVYNSLKEGDNVLLLRLKGGQSFVVLCKI